MNRTLTHRLDRRQHAAARIVQALFIAVAMLFFNVLPIASSAQILPTPAPSATPAPVDPFGRETPRSSLTGLVDALGAKDYDRAAHYLDIPVDSDPRLLNAGAELTRRLQEALDAGGSLTPFAMRSNDPAGRIDDDLPADQENVGTLDAGPDGAPILLQRRAGPEGQPIWRLAPATIRLLMKRPSSTTAETQETKDTGPTIGGAPLMDWLRLLGLAATAFIILRLTAVGLLAGLSRLVADPEKSALYNFARAALPPLALYGAMVMFFVWGDAMPVAIVARQTLLRYAGIVAWVALAWFLLRMIDGIGDFLTNRMHRRERRQAISVITLIRRAAKVVLLAISLVVVLDTLGVDVTTGIAALGIGGIALALGAQKTIENLVGSVTVIVDRPVQVGDFCKVGDVLGTVEDIGMRSTRIRTLERTIVTIPNGAFSSLQIDNFARRDRFLFHPVIGLEYGIGADRMREATEAIANILAGHENVLDDGARARFINFGESSLEIEIFAYILAKDYAESLIYREELLLSIMARLEDMGLGIAFPTRTLFLRPESDGKSDV
ncbi:mechanosensitive ion channel family protein [Stakelama sp. CBK3Z-3]|uniref:Mechanosensitive ion channel family protein n=1 Tax=Stakelama flava TaxID=2860338 RepID=A0ABS6XNM0_9SPHN|nr:mechanosensitive ion channel family protein [Stakelama flava]MBW4331812.1 mechanosensitive ion channel family protein [Stakelama flava]